MSIGSLARQVQRVSDDAARAERDVRSLAGDGAVLSWISAAGEVLRGAIEDFPGQLLPACRTASRTAPFSTLPQATHTAEATVPRGTVFFEGPAGPQVGRTMPESPLLGRGGQVVFPEGVPADWLTPGIRAVGR